MQVNLKADASGARQHAGGASRHGKVWLVGPGPGDPELLMVKAARLKGGDPYVFGRGGEEALTLAGA